MEIGEVKRPTDIIIDEALKGHKKPAPRKRKKKTVKPAAAAVKKPKPKPKPRPKAPKKKPVARAVRVVKKKSVKRPAKPAAIVIKKKPKPKPKPAPKKKPAPKPARAAVRPRNKKPARASCCFAPFAIIAAIALAGALLFVYVSETETEVYNKVAPVAAVQKPEPPVKVQKTEKPKNEIEHVVKRGEILFDISKRYTGSGWNYRSIARYNHIGNPNVIEVGDVIKIRLK